VVRPLFACADLLLHLSFCTSRISVRFVLFCNALSLSLSLSLRGGVAHIIALVAWREVSLFLSTCWMFSARLASSFTLFFHGEE
jgi:hypothetical protein